MIYDIIGYLAGFICSITLFPQIYTVYKRKSANDLSYFSLNLMQLSTILWIIYGFYIMSYQTIICDIIIFLLNSNLIIMKFYYKNIYKNSDNNELDTV